MSLREHGPRNSTTVAESSDHAAVDAASTAQREAGSSSTARGLFQRKVMRRLAARKGGGGGGVGAGAPEAVEQANNGGGAALPADVRGQFERSLGTDLGDVRVHTGGPSNVAATAIDARAYTTGQNIHFASGQYDPGSSSGKELLAHEVAHTVQQRGGAASSTQAKLEVSEPGDDLETEADTAATAMVQGEAAAVSGHGAGVARKDAPEKFDLLKVRTWLLEHARKEGKETLFQFFMRLDPSRQTMALTQAIGAAPGGMTMKDVKAKLTNWSGREVLWDKLAPAMRAMGPQANHLADGAKDYTNYTAAGVAGVATVAGSGLESVTSGVADPMTHTGSAGSLQQTVQTLSGGSVHADSWTVHGGTAGVSGVVGVGAAVANPVGIVGSAIGAYEGIDQMESGTTSQRAMAAGQTLGNVSEMGRGGAQTGLAAMNLGGAGSAAAATVAAGSLGVISGAGFLAQGAAGYVAHTKRASAIAEQRTRLEKERAARQKARAEQGAVGEDPAAAAHHAASERRAEAQEKHLAKIESAGAASQQTNKDLAGVNLYTAAKGAALIAGGALILASNPIGWMVMGGAAVIGLIGVIVKYRAKKARQKDLVDRELGLTPPPSQLKGAASKEREKKRDQELQSRGFNSVEDFYNSYIAITASYLQMSAHNGDPEAMELVRNLGLEPAHATVEEVAKRIHGS